MKRTGAALGFDDPDSGSEEEEVQVSRKFGKSFGKGKPRTNKDLIAESLKNQAKVKEYEANDPDVYQYDEVYDGIQQAREAEKPKRKDDGSSQYIDRLIEAKKKRNLDKLHLQDLKLKKEREEEGDEFKDKEVFVTSSYKKFKEERQKEQDELENGNINEFRNNITNNELKQSGDKQEKQEVQNDEEQTTNNSEVIYTSPFINSLNSQSNGLNNNDTNGDNNGHDSNRNTTPQNTHTQPQRQRPNREHLIPPMLSEEVVQQYRERFEQRLAERQRVKTQSKPKIGFKIRK